PLATWLKSVPADSAAPVAYTALLLSADGPTSISGTTPVASDGTFSAGTYTLSETDGPSGYTASVWTCTNGVTVNGSSEITLANGQSTTRTINHDDHAPSLTLHKTVTK